MAPKALSAFRPGVYRVGLFEGYGVNERGENEMRLQGASAARPFRIRLDYAVNPWTKEDISCEGLKPGEDMVIVGVSQEALFAPKSGTKFVIESALSIDRIDAVQPARVPAGASS
jgi:hypothetical protein